MTYYDRPIEIPNQKPKGKLVIFYKPETMLKPEHFNNVSDPDKVISKRNAIQIGWVTFRGKPFDFSNHLKLYK